MRPEGADGGADLPAYAFGFGEARRSGQEPRRRQVGPQPAGLKAGRSIGQFCNTLLSPYFRRSLFRRRHAGGQFHDLKVAEMDLGTFRLKADVTLLL